MNSREIGCCTPVVGFDGAYAPANWGEYNVRDCKPTISGSIVWNAPDSLVITGQDDNQPDSDNCCTQQPAGFCVANTWVEIIIPGDGVITFDWSVVDNDFFTNRDYLFYDLDYVETQLYFYPPTISGSVSIPVTTGQIFAIRVWTRDVDFGELIATISNFNFACPPAS